MPRKLTNQVFLERANSIHKGKYSYPEEINGVERKIKIICPEHGEFYLTPHLHLNGCGCKFCNVKKNQIGKNKKRWDTKSFIEEAKKVHRDKYDYSKVEYINYNTKVCIICPEHGEFWQTPNRHLNGNGCQKCGIKISSQKKRKTFEKFIEEAESIHCNKYDYSEVKYVSFHKKVKIICPKHGEFWQTPSHHLNGEGCPNCRNSLCENYLSNLFSNNNIKYEKEKSFEWLKNSGYLLIDFYLPDYNIAIECQGGQHVKPIKQFGGEISFNKQKENDKIKYNLCKKNGIKIIYIFDIYFKKYCLDYEDKNVIFYKKLDDITIKNIL